MLGTAFAIRDWLQQDAESPIAQRHERDRQLAVAQLSATELTALAEPTATAAAKWRAMLSWWQALPKNVQGPKSRLSFWQRLAKALLALAGLLLGAATAAAALAYDGQHPINLISLLGLLVGLPMFLLLLSLLLMPGRIWGLGWLQEVLATLNPGQWLSYWINRRGGSQDFGWLQAPSNQGRRLGKWLMLNMSQYLALGFAVGAIGTLMAMVTFSDLAFGWSTTLKLEAEVLVPWVQASTAPWRSWLPVAVPSAELIQGSQYFRGADHHQGVRSLGDWWPYVLLCLLFYGLLPRLILLLFTRWQVSRQTRLLLVNDPLALGLLQRMTTPRVDRAVAASTANAPADLTESELAGVTAEAVAGAGNGRLANSSSARLPQTLPPVAGGLALLVWNDAVTPEEVEASAIEFVGPPLWLGSTTAQAAVSNQLADALQVAPNLMVAVKGWEPPLLEFHDFLERTVTELSPTGRLLVCPVGLPGEPLSEQDQQVWAHSLAGLNHPQILLAIAG